MGMCFITTMEQIPIIPHMAFEAAYTQLACKPIRHKVAPRAGISVPLFCHRPRF